MIIDNDTWQIIDDDQGYQPDEVDRFNIDYMVASKYDNWKAATVDGVNAIGG